VRAGTLSIFFDRTQEILAARRLDALNTLARTPPTQNPHEALARPVALVGETGDIPFASAYVLDPSVALASLVAAIGVQEGGTMAPREQRITTSSLWPLQQVLESGLPLLLDDIDTRFHGHRVRDMFTPRHALLYPVKDPVQDRVLGVLVLGATPRVSFDDA